MTMSAPTDHPGVEPAGSFAGTADLLRAAVDLQRDGLAMGADATRATAAFLCRRPDAQ